MTSGEGNGLEMADHPNNRIGRLDQNRMKGWGNLSMNRHVRAIYWRLGEGAELIQRDKELPRKKVEDDHYQPQEGGNNQERVMVAVLEHGVLKLMR